MSINPGSGYEFSRWNYSNREKEDFSETIEGCVVAIQEVQKTVFKQPSLGEFWPDGNPKMNIRIALACEDGKIRTFEFQPASKAARQGLRKSIHMDLFNLSCGNMYNLIGKTINIHTPEGVYGQGNPRPFECYLSDKNIPMPDSVPEALKVEKVLVNSSAAGGRVQQPQQQYQQQYQQPMQQQYMQQYMQQPQPQYQQPMQQQYVQQQSMMQQQAQPMQQAPMGAQWQPMPQAQPMQQGGGFAQKPQYMSEDIPF